MTEDNVTDTEEIVEEDRSAKRFLVIDAIREGGKTHPDLMKAANCKAASLASLFTYMRLMGQEIVDGESLGTCPVKDEAGIYTMVDLATWNKMKADKKANAKTRKVSTKTPVDRLKAAIIRVAKNLKAKESYTKKMEETEEPTRELEIRAELADLNHELAEIELDAANVACPDGVPEEVIEDDAIEITDEPADLA